jgi:hypothetical protein
MLSLIAALSFVYGNAVITLMTFLSHIHEGHEGARSIGSLCVPSRPSWLPVASFPGADRLGMTTPFSL